MTRHRSLMALMLALAMLALALPGATARSAPNGEVVPQRWLLGHLNQTGVRGIVAIQDDADDRLYFTLIGMQAGGSLRLVFSEQSCADALLEGFPYSFTADSRGHRSTVYELKNVLVSSWQSVRVRVHRGGKYRPLACATLRLYDLVEQQGSTAALREHGRTAAAAAPEADTWVTIFRRPEAKGIIVHGNAGNDEVRVRAVLAGLAPSKEYYLIGGFADCDASWSKSERAAKIGFNTNSLGQLRMGKSTPILFEALSGDSDGDGDVDGNDFLAWRIKRASGQSVGCYEVDARLARH